MAMQNLITNECGGANPLMKLTEQVQNRTFQQESYDQYRPFQVNHVLPEAPQTFNMQRLLDEVEELQQPPQMPEIHGARDLRYMKQVCDWEKEFMSENKIMNRRVKQFSGTSLTRPMQFHPEITPARFMNPMIIPRIPIPARANWNENNIATIGPSEIQKTGKEILESFEKDEVDAAEHWVGEYKNSAESKIEEEELEKEVLEVMPDTTQNDMEYWEKLQKDWNELFSQEQFMNQEDFTVQSQGTDKDYSFEENNPFAGLQNPFEEGLKKLEDGDLISAILLFEEAVTKEPEHAEAWQYLGTSQAENEQELLAIRALNRCLDLQANNLEARMALAVSYTNESMYFQACESLKTWIKENPRYAHLLNNEEAKEPTNKQQYTSSLVSGVMLKDVESTFLSAARLSPQRSIDPDIQTGLGVLFNISRDYYKAIDCFKTGLQARPDSAYLWNKLGATLANSGKSAEAIEAYRNALELRPGYIRCRYNLGISCINMKVYDSAIEHFLTALNMQRQGEDRTRNASTMSENIWDTLRMTVSLIGRTDLFKVIESRDLAQLNRVFGT